MPEMARRTFVMLACVASVCGCRDSERTSRDSAHVASPARHDAAIDAARAQPSRAITIGSIDPTLRAQLLSEFAKPPKGTLGKAELSEPMHAVVRMLASCYERANTRDRYRGGVINTRFSVVSGAGRGAIVAIRGFDASSPLGRSQAFRDCMRATAEMIVLAPIATGGTAEITYPITFAAQQPDNRHAEILDRANSAAAAARWGDALHEAEVGLEQTSFDGTSRRPLIELAGIAACHLRDAAKAQRYAALASATVEPMIRAACTANGIALPANG